MVPDSPTDTGAPATPAAAPHPLTPAAPVAPGAPTAPAVANVVPAASSLGSNAVVDPVPVAVVAADVHPAPAVPTDPAPVSPPSQGGDPASPVPAPTTVVTPTADGTATDAAATADDAHGPGPTIVVTPQNTAPEGPVEPGMENVPTVSVTSPPEPPAGEAAPPGMPYDMSRYERGGTNPPRFRASTVRIEPSADVDPYELVLNGGLPKDAASFPVYRPVRPVHTVDRPTLTVSGDNGFALPQHEGRSREFYASPQVIQEAQAGLAAAGGTFRLTVDDTSYVRYGGPDAEHTLHQVTVEGSGSGATGPVVLVGSPQGPHLALRNDSLAHQREADMREAVETNLRHYGDQLLSLAQQLHQLEPDSGRTELARALADLHQARTGLAAPDIDPAERARLERAEAAALAAAVHALAADAGDAYGTSDEDWYLHLAPGAALTLPTVDWSL